MKVLHVIPSIGLTRGGPSMVLRTMAQGLVERGVEVHVATTDDNGPGRQQNVQPITIEHGVKYHFFRRQVRFYTLSWPLYRWLGQNVPNYDIVHIHALFSFPVVAAAYWSSQHGVPYVVRPLGTLNKWGVRTRRPWLKRISIRYIERRVLARAVAVHFTSEQELAEASMQATVMNPVIIPNPIVLSDSPMAHFRSGSSAARKLRTIVFLSRIDRKKGIDLLLPAFAELRRQAPDLVLVIAGDGDLKYRAELEQQAQELKIDRDINWLGFISGREKHAALRAAEFFVLPSYSENFGVAVVEAMAAGVPVIVSDQVAIHREIAVARAGIVVPCSVRALADSMLWLLQNQNVRAEMAENALELAKHYSVGKVTAELIRLYDRIASEQKFMNERSVESKGA